MNEMMHEEEAQERALAAATEQAQDAEVRRLTEELEETRAQEEQARLAPFATPPYEHL